MHTRSRKKSNRNWYFIALLIVTAGLIVYFLLNSEDETTQPVQIAATDIPFTKQGELMFIHRDRSDTLARIDIEVADNNRLRARGLMYRRSLPENAGMLFIHNEEEIQSFWMKNTYIPLDMIFVNADKEIVTIHVNTAPLKEWNYASTKPALYVVEVNAGFTNRHGIGTGDKIDFVITR